MISFSKPSLCAAALLLICGQLPANNYHVNSASGNDSRSAEVAQSPETPWKTIQRGAGELSPGDKLTVHAGTYEETDIKIPSGTSEKPVEIVAAGNVIISIKNPDIKKKQFTGLLLKGVRFARISGFTIYCGDPNVECPIGIRILDSNNCLIKDNVISTPKGYGIFAGAGSSRNQIEHNSISGCGSGIVLAQNEGNLVTGNDIFDNTMSGIDIKKGARNNEFSDNLIIGNLSGVVASSEGQSANNTLKNCEISGNKNYGVFIADPGAVISIRNSKLEKNLWKNIYCKDGAAYEGGSNYIEGGEKSFFGCKMAADDSAEKAPQGSGLLTPRKSPSAPDIKAALPSAESSGTKIIADPIIWKIGVEDKKFSEFIPPGSGKLNYDPKTGICVCDLGFSKQFNAFPTQMASGALNTGYGSLPTHVKIRWDEPKGGARILKLYIAVIMDSGNLPADYSVTTPSGAKYDFDLPPYAFGENTAFYEFPVIAQKGRNEMTISSNYADSVRRSYFMFDCIELLDANMIDGGKIAVNFKKKGDKPVAQLTNLSDSAANLNIAFEWVDTAGKITYAEPAKQLGMPGLSNSEIELTLPAGAADKFAFLKIKVYDGPAKLKETGLVFWDSIGKIHAKTALADICLREFIRTLTVESKYDKSFLSETRQKAFEEIKAGRETQKNSLVEFESQFSSIYKSYEQKNNVKTAQLEEICRKLDASCRAYESLTELCKSSFPKKYAGSPLPGLSLPVKKPDKLTRKDVRDKIIFAGNWFPSASKVWSDLGFFRAFDFLGVSEDCITSKVDTEPDKYDFSLDDEAVKLNNQKGFKTVLTSPFDVPRMPTWLIKKHGLANLYLKGENGAIPSGRWHPLNIFHPDVQEYCKNFYSAWAENFKDNNNVTGYETFNEPYLAVGSWDPAGFERGGFNPEALAQYKEYLRKKYGSVAALNSTNKTAFKDFNEADPPRGKTGEKIQPLLYDWSCFMSESLAEFMRSCYAEIRKKDQKHVIIPQFACHFNYMVPTLAGQIWGLDLVKLQDAINPYVDYFSFHGANTSDISYAASLSRLFDKPLGRDEYYWNAPGIAFGEDASSAFTERNMWEELARGSKYFEFFAIAGTDRSHYTSLFNHDCASHLMRRSAMTICVMKDIAEKLTQTFNSTKYSENNAVAIIQPSVSTFLQYPPYKSGTDAYSIHNVLEEDNRAITFLPEEFILNKKVSLSKYKIAILPYATYFPNGLGEELLKYVENGGILIASGACGLYTPEGLTDGKLLKKLFGENAEVAYLPSRGISSLTVWQSGGNGSAGPFVMRVDTDCVYALNPTSVNPAEVLLKSGEFPIILEKKLGKGKFLLSSVPFGGSEYFEKIIRNYIAQNAPPSFWSDAKNVGLIMRDYNDNPDKQCLIAIDRDTLRPENSIREAEIFVRGEYSSINDLKRGGKEVLMQFENGVTSFKTFLYPGQGQIFSMVKNGAASAAPAAKSAAFQIEAASSDYKAVPAMRAEFADLSAGIEKLTMLPGIWNFQVNTKGRKLDAAALHDGSSILIIVKIPGNFPATDKMSMSLFFDTKLNGRENGGRFAKDDFKYTVYTDGKRKIVWGNKDDVFGRVLDKDLRAELKNVGGDKIFLFSMPLSNIFHDQEKPHRTGFALSLESGGEEKATWPDAFDGSMDTSLFGKLLLAPAETSAVRETFAPNKNGFITHWLATGPFPNPGRRPNSIGRDYDFLKESGGEDLASPISGVPFTVSQSGDLFDSSIPCVERLKGSDMLQNSYSRVWRPQAFPGDFIDLTQLSKFNTNVVFYTYCEVVFDEAKELNMAAGSDDGIKVWVNGAEVMNVHKYRGAKKDEDIVTVKVKKGLNKILVKTDTDIGGFGFYLRFLDIKGTPEVSYKILIP